MPHRIVLILCLGAAGTAAAADLVTVPHHANQTEQREYDGRIPSIYWDLRTEPDGVRAGLMAPWPHAIGSIRVDQTRYSWADDTVLVNAPGAPLVPQIEPLTEERTELTATLRQSIWTPFRGYDAVLEVEGGFTIRDATHGDVDVESGSSYLADTRVLLLLPIVTERYTGILLGAGVTLPSGDGEDWIRAHGNLGGLVSARLSTRIPGVSWTSITGMIEYGFCNSAENVVYPNEARQDATHNYSGLAIGGRLGFRLDEDWAVGGTLRYDQLEFQDIEIPGLSVTVDEDIYRYRAAAYITWQVVRQTFLTATVSYTASDEEGGSAYHAGLGLEVLTW